MLSRSAARPRLLHLTASDVSLSLLLGPQLQAFRRAGYDVTAASAPGRYVAGLAAAGIAHLPLHSATRAVDARQDVAALVELHRLFRRVRPDIVHTHNPKPGVLGRLAARAAGVPHVVNTVHGLYAQPGDPLRRRIGVFALERLAAACSDAELVQNPEDLATLARLGVPARRLHLLGNGIDLDRFDPAAVPRSAARQVRAEVGAGPDDVVMAVVARLVREKGLREVFGAAAALRGRPDVRFVVVGPSEPDKADRLTPGDVRAAEADGVRFLGLREDVPAIYAACDVFVLPSYREGFPRSVMEAAAMGRPVVATDIRGCRQAVEDGVTGLLVPARTVGPLADAVTRLADDPPLRAEMGAAARVKAAREFDQRTVIETTLRVYDSLLNPPAGLARPPHATLEVSGVPGG